MHLRFVVFCVLGLFAAACNCGYPVPAAQPPSASTSTVSLDRTDGLIADGVDTATVTVTVLDQNGKPLSGVEVAVAASGDGNILGAASATDGSGISTATLASTRAETKTLTVSVTTGGDPVELESHPTVTFVPGPAKRLSFAVPPSNVQAGAAIDPAVQVSVQDARGNLLRDATAEITVALGGGDTSAKLGGTTKVAAASGTATFTGLTVNRAAKAYTLSASAEGLEPATSTPFDVTVGAPAKLSFLTQPSQVVAGVVMAPAVVVALQDAQGNLLPEATAAVTLAIAENPGTASLGGTLTATPVNGKATFADLSLDKAGVGYELAATAQGFGGATSAAFTVTPATAAARTSTLEASPTSLVADGVAATEVTVTVRDGLLNAVPGVAVTFDADGSDNTFTPANAKAVTGADGKAKISLSSTHADAKTISAHVGGGFDLQTQVTFTPGAASQVKTTLVASPASLVADGVAGSTLTLSVLDAQGNPVPSAPVTLTASGTGNTLTPSSGNTDGSGQLAARLSSTVAEVKDVTASVGGISVTAQVTFLPGTADAMTSALTAAPASLVADGAQSTVLKLVARDAQGNPLPGLAVTFDASGTGAAFTPTSGQATTGASGEAQVSLVSTKAESKTVTAHFGTTSLTTTVVFAPGAAAAAKSTVAALPASLMADGTALSTLTVTALDAQGNPVPGVTIQATASGSANDLAPAQATTDGSGLATFTVSSTHAEKKTVSFDVGGLFTLTADVTFVPGAPARATSSFAAASATAIADGVDAATATLTVKDAQGNPVPNAAVSFAVSGTNNAPASATATTDASGVAVVTFTSTRAEAKTITATVGGFDLTAVVTFVPGSPSKTTSTLVASPGSLVADGVTGSTLTLSVFDAQGNPVPGATATLTASGSGNTLTPSSSTTDASGQLTARLSSTVAEVKDVTASVGGISVSAQVTFLPGAADAATSALSAAPASLVADGAQATVLKLVARDAQGNPLPGIAVAFDASGTGAAFTPSSGQATSDASGEAQVSLTSTKAESKTITARFGGTSLTTTVVFLPGTAAAAKSSVAALPSALVADGTALSTLTVTALDAHGNPVPGVTVQATATGSANDLAPAQATTDGSGLATFTLASTKAEKKTVSFDVGGLFTLSAEVTFVPGAPAKSTTTFSASPASATADGADAITATLTVRDAKGNPVPGADVTFAVSGTGNALAPATATTDSSGAAVVTLTSTKAEAKTITATVGGFDLTAAVTFAPGAPSKITSTLAASPGSVTADGTATSAITLTVRDAQGNLVPGAAVSLSATGTGNTLAPATGTTDASGVVSAALASTKAEAKTVTASVGGFTLTAGVTFEPGAPDETTSTFSASPSSATADGADAVALSVVVRDAHGNLVPGAQVSLESSGSQNTFAVTGGTTDLGGQLTSALRSTKAEAKTLTAKVGGFSLFASVTFVPGAPLESASTLAVAPATVTADGSAAATITVTLTDAQGNRVPNAPVSLTASGTANVLAPASGKTDASGVFTATLASTRAESKRVSATAGGFTLVADVTFVPGAPDSAKSSFATSPATVTADGTATSTLTLVVKDAQGNFVPNAAVSLTSTGTGNTLAPATGNTSASGVFTATLASTKAEAKTITASVGGFTLTADVTFVPGAPVKATSSLAAAPSSVTANGTATSAITVTVRDAQGNAVPGASVSLTASGTGNALNPTSGTTDASGMVTATLASTKAEAKTITASVGGFSLTADVTFVAGAPDSAKTAFAASPTTVTANGTATSTLTLTVKDAQGNLVPGAAVALSSTGTGNTLAPATGNTSASGVFTATLASTKAEAKAITATVGGFSLTADVTFIPGAPDSAKSTFAASPTSVTANGTATSTLTLTVKDAQGNVVPSTSVSLTSTGTGNTLAPASGNTNASGVFTATLASTKAEAKTVTATVGGFSLTADVTFVPGAPDSTKTNFAASPTTITANGTATTTLTLTVKDAQGNLVPGAAVSLTSTGAGNTLTPASGNTTASGVFTATLASTKAEAKTITATAGGFSLTADVTFVPGAPDSTKTTFAASPTSVTANGTATSTLTVTVKDAQGNVVPSAAVSLTTSGTGNTLAPASGNTNASGVFTSTLASTKAEAKTITATVGGFSLTADVTFVPGAPDSTKTSFAASPTSVTANGTATSALTLTVKDAQGNLVPGAAVSLTATGSGNTLTPATGNTNASGVFTATLASTKAEAKTITATVGGFSLTADATFVPGAPDSAKSTFAGSPTSVTANGTATSTLTLTVKDAQGNVVPSAAVSLTSSGSGNTLAPASGNTNASGVFTATLASTKAEAKTVTATVAGFSLTADVTFVPGAPDSTKSTFAASPTTITANGTATSALTLTVKDAQGNLVPGAAVALTATGSGNTLTPGSGNTSASGVFTATLASTKAEAKTITATVGGFSLTADVTFVPGAPDSAKSTFAASPTSVTANGTATSTLTLTVKDAQGNVVPSAAVSLTSSGSGNTLAPASGNTNASGVFTATLASTKAEAKTVTATVAGFSLTADVTFVPGAPDSTKTSFAASPTSVTANGTATTTLTLTVKDAQGNLVPGAAVSVTATGSGNTLTPASGNTNTSGVFAATLASTKAEAKTITATVGGFSLTADVTFVPGAPDSGKSTLAASPTSVTANGTATTTLSVTVKDAQGNVVPGAAVVLTSTGSANTFSPASGNTNPSGVFTATLASTKAEAKTITATVGGFGLTADVTFVPGAPDSGKSTLAASPTSVTADGSATSTLTLTVKDAQGNLVPNAAVSLTANGTGNTLTPATGNTGASGVFTATLASTKAEAKTVTATVAGFTLTAGVTFTPGPAASANTTLAAAPTTVTANGSATSTLTVTVKDAQGNAIAGAAVSISATGTGNTLTPATGNTDASGVFTATLASTKAEAKTVTATVASLTLTAGVTFVAGPPATANSSIAASPTTVVANGTAASAITVTVKDAQGNPVGNQPVTLTSTGTVNTFSPASGNTNASGVFTSSFTSTKAEAKTVTATAGAASVSTGVSFVPGPASNVQSSFASDRTSAPGNGSAAIVFTVTVRDAFGNLIANDPVSLTATGTQNTLSPASGNTGAGGVFTSSMTSTKIESKTVTATLSSGGTMQLTVSFVIPQVRFTTCNKTGSAGPAQSDCNTAYSGTPLAGAVTVSGSFQTWTVPYTGVYRIEAFGAQGGAGGSGTAGGLGARIRGDVSLTAGQVLKIVVGQQGGTELYGGGGGGGSFVLKSDNTPLVIAGGGGGGNGGNPGALSRGTFNGGPGLTGGCGGDSNQPDGTEGAAAPGTGGGALSRGGCNGYGGGGGVSAGGGGLFDRGGTSSAGATPGTGLLNGGGIGGAGNVSTNFGGFGGGQTQTGYGGGGGGYSGGGAGNWNGPTHGNGGGGGSYNVGSNASSVSGAQTGPGLVTIDQL